MNARDGIFLALAIGVGYTVYRAVKSSGEVFKTWGEAVGSGLFDFFNRDQVGEMLFYTVVFPNGERHAVPSRSVDNGGYFTNKNLSPNYAGDGKRYRLVIGKADRTNRAFPA